MREHGLEIGRHVVEVSESGHGGHPAADASNVGAFGGRHVALEVVGEVPQASGEPIPQLRHLPGQRRQVGGSALRRARSFGTNCARRTVATCTPLPDTTASCCSTCAAPTRSPAPHLEGVVTNVVVDRRAGGEGGGSRCRPDSEHERSADETDHRRDGALGWALPGRLTGRFTRCGNPTCRCRAVPRSFTVGDLDPQVDNKTDTRTIIAEQAEATMLVANASGYAISSPSSRGYRFERGHPRRPAPMTVASDGQRV